MIIGKGSPSSMDVHHPGRAVGTLLAFRVKGKKDGNGQSRGSGWASGLSLTVSNTAATMNTAILCRYFMRVWFETFSNYYQ